MSNSPSGNPDGVFDTIEKILSGLLVLIQMLRKLFGSANRS